jgi:hypothetical protein
MGRAVGAIVVAFLLWSGLWLGFTAVAQAAFPEIIDPEQPLAHVGALLGYIAYSVVISVVAGYACAIVKGASPMKTVWVFALIQLVVGIGFEISYWEMTPVWYHVVFLALIVPTTVWGGVLRARKTAAVAVAG